MWLKVLKTVITGIPLRIIGLMLVFIMLILLAWSITPGLIASFNKGDGGIVIVDSPEVYSRERLINDRFRQVSWLEKELNDADNQFFGNQAISDLRQIWGLEAKVGNSGSVDGGAENNAASDGQGMPAAAGRIADEDKIDKARDSNLSVTPSERFRDVLAYREEIRTEMMETLLDDRHDIKGNTLYRLKFDTTVLPEENTEKLVVIQVMLSKAGLCDETSLSRSNVTCMSIDTIHKEWIRQTEDKLNKVMDGTINYIKGMNLPTADFAGFVRYLQGNSSTLFDRPMTIDNGVLENTRIPIPISNASKWDRLVQLDYQCLDDEFRKTEGLSEEQKRQCYRPAYSFFSPGADQRNLQRYLKLRILLYSYYAAYLATTRPFAEFRQAHNEYARLIRTRFNHGPVGSDILALIKKAEHAENSLLRYAVANYYIDKYTHPNWEKSKKCDAFYDSKLTQFEDKSLSCLAHITKTTCNDIDHCSIRVMAEMPSERVKAICDMGEGSGDECRYKRIRDRFEELLRYQEAYYSYAITPKESTQRVLSIVSERRQKQLALSLIASASDDLDAGAIESLTKAISESASQIEQIQRKPLILSFGRGQPVFTDKPDDSPGSIDFGWFIGPKYMVSNSSKGAVGFVHAPVQYSLSAVISVPNWWTALNLKVKSCWIEQDEISQLKLERGSGDAGHTFVEDICHAYSIESSHSNDIDYVVRLPGSPEELPRKLGYEIERVPSVRDLRAGEPLADFFIGQEDASLIITGDELWRSTVVTMGNQKADNIEVLPNMKGIIARFGKVRVPDQKMSSVTPKNTTRPTAPCVVYSKVVVWTSEGKTEQPLYVRIHPNPADEDKPRGFGECYIAPPPQ